MTEERSSTEDPLGALAELHAQTKSEPAAQKNVVNQRHCGKSQGKGKKLLLGNRSGLPCGPAVRNPPASAGATALTPEPSGLLGPN